MQYYKFQSRSGRAHVFTRHQQNALQRGGVWDVMQYTFIQTFEPHPDVRPTWTDAEIFTEHLSDCALVTHVGMFHPQFRDDSRPYFVRGPRRTDADAAVRTIHDALKVARGLFGCQIITMSRGDDPPPYDIADELGVVLLAI